MEVDSGYWRIKKTGKTFLEAFVPAYLSLTAHCRSIIAYIYIYNLDKSMRY